MSTSQRSKQSVVVVASFFAFLGAVAIFPSSAHAAYEAIGYHYKYVTQDGGQTYIPPTGVQELGPYAGLSAPKEFQACSTLGYTRTDDQFEPPDPSRQTWGTCYEYYDANGSIYDFDGAGQDKTLYYSKPIPAVNGSCTVSPASIASGGNATWSASASGGIGSYTYAWTGTDGLSGSGASRTKSYTSAGTKTASVTITSGPNSKTISCSNSLTVTSTLPDLTAGEVTPTSGTTGTALWFSNTVTNIGSYASGSFPILFQIDNGALFNSEYVAVLASNPSVTGSASYTFSTPGTYQVRACANYNTSWTAIVSESDYSNNCGPWSTVTITLAPAADLTAGSVTPTSATVGQATTLSATASNGGTGAAGSFPVLFQISETSALRNSAYLAGLPPSASGGASVSYTFPSVGTYQVRACANYNTSWVPIVSESDYSNNCGPWTTVTVSSAAPAATCSLSANPSTVPSTLTWSSTNATSCTGGGFSTAGATSGTASVSTAGSYTLSCTGAGGACSTQVVSVGSACTLPTGTLTASPNRIKPGQGSTISYSATGITGSCNVTGPGVSATLPAASCTVPAGTAATGPLTTQSVYILTCDGVERARAVVNVVPSILEF